MPAVKKMMAEGSYTLNTMNVLPTGSMPNWASILYSTTPAILDTAEKISGPERVIRYISSIDASKPSFTFIHFDEADGAGHGPGHNSPDYYAALRQIDAYLTDILKTVETAGLPDDSVFILCADHGGIFYLANNDYYGVLFQHGGDTPEEQQVPLIFFGKEIKEGYGITVRVNTYDIAPTIAAIFGVSPAEPWLGRPLWEILK